MASTSNVNGQRTERKAVVSAQTMQMIADALQGLQFGHVTIMVQDGSVVLIERTEKRRPV